MNLLKNLYHRVCKLNKIKLKYMKTKLVIAGQQKKKKTSEPEKHLRSTDIIVKRISLFI